MNLVGGEHAGPGRGLPVEEEEPLPAINTPLQLICLNVFTSQFWKVKSPTKTST
jgi:hypothetical protein